MSPFIKKNRWCRPFRGAGYFKPQGVPLAALVTNVLELDELEAVHLCDYEELSQQQAAERIGVSDSTLQRLLYSGRKKIADAVYSSKALLINKSPHVTEIEPSEGTPGQGLRGLCRRRRGCHD